MKTRMRTIARALLVCMTLLFCAEVYSAADPRESKLMKLDKLEILISMGNKKLK